MLGTPPDVISRAASGGAGLFEHKRVMIFHLDKGYSCLTLG